MIVYERIILERLSCSQARMGLGSPLVKHNCNTDITTWALEHLLKPLSVNAVGLQVITVLFYVLYSVPTFIESGL